jgi:hypothetical protein
MIAHPVKASAAALLAAFALGATAQQPAQAPAKPTPPPKAPAAAFQGKEAFKGRLKPGLYEMTVETDMTNMPNFPKDKAKQTDKRQQCITPQDVEKGIENDPNCPTTAFAISGNQINMAASCKDGARLETRMVFSSTGYTAEMKVSGKHEGKPIGSTHKMTTKYIGPCK